MRAFIISALFIGAQAGTIKMAPATSEKPGLKLKPKAAEGLVETDTKSTATLAMTQKMLAQVFKPGLDNIARNLAARQYFHNVYHLPTTLQKMSATEAFLQSSDAYQRSIGRNPGTVERLTPNELEHWLTTEYLAEDFKNAGIGLAFMYPKSVLAPGLISRGPEFASFYKNRTGCLTDHVRQGVSERRASLNYGTSCGNTNKLGSLEGCDSVHRTVIKIENEDRQVCADAGTDACCARHDLIRTGITINPLATFSHCKANNALHNCMRSVQPKAVFEDKRGISEMQANTAAQCIYQVMPCLAATNNKFYEINFKTKNVPHVRSMYPQRGDHHVQVVFPFDQSYGEDLTDAATVYRPSMKSDFEYSHWRHIDPPSDMWGAFPTNNIRQDPNNAMWDSLE
eukprot:gnl/MRDRNA2_/MRDRNA2_84570_c0_seq2.p1 gnl/MRDRNA2_/MRDRNA2_84570_c0~~gnl/MRDRNA2_/MRDRNA2_84570_c0_seq2.p1  ORF type:complete len:398 (+),score=63.35 gnl/MRDRNA2_/MRDRNA2_84570_c0_seq2:77-1270(+)